MEMREALRIARSIISGGKMRGHIIRVPASQSYAFIKGNDGADYFMHRGQIRDFDLLYNAFQRADKDRVKIQVTFDTEEGPKGKRANNVIVDDNPYF